MIKRKTVTSVFSPWGTYHSLFLCHVCIQCVWVCVLCVIYILFACKPHTWSPFEVYISVTFHPTYMSCVFLCTYLLVHHIHYVWVCVDCIVSRISTQVKFIMSLIVCMNIILCVFTYRSPFLLLALRVRTMLCSLVMIHPMIQFVHHPDFCRFELEQKGDHLITV